jgi:hypothetical protein
MNPGSYDVPRCGKSMTCPSSPNQPCRVLIASVHDRGLAYMIHAWINPTREAMLNTQGDLPGLPFRTGVQNLNGLLWRSLA